MYFGNNCWCLNDVASIQSTLYDGYKNIAKGLIIFANSYKRDCVTITSTAHIGETLEYLIAYPNPATTEIFINLPSGAAQILNGYTIRNVMGGEVSKEAYEIEQQLGKLRLNTANLASGMYTIQFVVGHKLTQTKFLKLK